MQDTVSQEEAVKLAAASAIEFVRFVSPVQVGPTHTPAVQVQSPSRNRGGSAVAGLAETPTGVLVAVVVEMDGKRSLESTLVPWAFCACVARRAVPLPSLSDAPETPTPVSESDAPRKRGRKPKTADDVGVIAVPDEAEHTPVE